MRTTRSGLDNPHTRKMYLKKFRMEDCKPVSTLVNTSSKLTQATDEDKCVDQTLYQSAVGSLMYLSVSTRPDISFAVSSLARFSSKPTTEHWTALKRLLQYLKGTLTQGILYTKDGSSSIIGYTDSDWAGDVNDRKSTSGYMFLLSGGPISRRSQNKSVLHFLLLKQNTLPWQTQHRSQFGSNNSWQNSSIPLMKHRLYCTKTMSKNPQFHGRAKHIDIKHLFIREKVSNGTIMLEYCSTSEMLPIF